MKKSLLLLAAVPLFLACGGGSGTASSRSQTDSLATDTFTWQTEQFADVRILRYQIPGWERLSLQQKKLAYYLVMAGLSGRDMMWDQNYKHNLKIRKALETILSSDKVQRTGADWDHFLTYTKEVFFSNGIHHHYGMDKFTPEFPRAYFEGLLATSGATLDKVVVDVMFDPAIDAKKVSLDPSKDLVLSSAVNFYGDDVNQKEVEEFYGKMSVEGDTTPPSYGLNSKVVRGKDGKLTEQVYKVDGMYGAALKEMVKWLELAKGVAESPEQAERDPEADRVLHHGRPAQVG